MPDGVINVVTGRGATAGAALTNNRQIKRMSFTGSPEVGQFVGEACGRNLVPVKLELGGKGAAVVFDDVDVKATAEALVGAITFHTGQVCCDATRWLIQKDIYDEFVGHCQSLMQNVKIGHPLDPSSQMGPVVNPKQRERVLGYQEKGKAEGAECLVRWRRRNRGGFRGQLCQAGFAGRFARQRRGTRRNIWTCCLSRYV